MNFAIINATMSLYSIIKNVASCTCYASVQGACACLYMPVHNHAAFWEDTHVASSLCVKSYIRTQAFFHPNLHVWGRMEFTYYLNNSIQVNCVAVYFQCKCQGCVWGGGGGQNILLMNTIYKSKRMKSKSCACLCVEVSLHYN